MAKVKDILSKMSITRDDFGYFGIYLCYYAEGGTREEVENKLLNKAAGMKKHKIPKRKKIYIHELFYGNIGLN